MATLLEHLDTAVVEDKEAGTYRCRREVFTDPELFELEIGHIFEGNWVFLVHESQNPENNDYFTTWIGRHPIVLTRDKGGELHAVINACAHRGCLLCRRKASNKGSFTCPFRGWTFSNSGKLLKVKDGKTGDYPPAFNTEGSHDLKKIARFENFRGFLFGGINLDVLPLADNFGTATTIIDLMVDQAADGIEVLRGNSSYIYDGNWKLQMENGADGYPVSAVHWNYSATTGRRNYEAESTRTVDANGWSKNVGGVYGFEHGHTVPAYPAQRRQRHTAGAGLNEGGRRAGDLIHLLQAV
jgi:benzoate/toluate 1,2-dioxygenase subunit alpha